MSDYLIARATELRVAASQALALLLKHEWCVDDAHRPYCDFCGKRSRAKEPSRKHHNPDCPWLRTVKALEGAL